MNGICLTYKGNILIFGGIRDPASDEDAPYIDGLLYNQKENTFSEIEDIWGFSKTTFSDPGYILDNKIYLSLGSELEQPSFIIGDFKDNKLTLKEFGNQE